MTANPAVRPKVVFLSASPYSRPLGPTEEKKFLLLETIADAFVVGFSTRARFERFHQHASFHLAPRLPVAVLRYGEFFFFSLVTALWLALRKRATIFVAQSPYEAVAGAVAKVIAHRLGRDVALVVESHGDFEQSVFLQRTIRVPSLYRFLMKRSARFALRRADVLRAVSASTREQLERSAPVKPIWEFFTWTDLDVFFAAGDGRLGDGSPRIVYAGALIPRKGLHHLIGAFARIAAEFPAAGLSIIGAEENPAYARRLKEMVRKNGLDHRVEFVSPLPQAELAQRMRSASVLALPSESEGLPRVVLEAMAVGLPVVATRVSGIPDVVSDGVNGLLSPPGDEDTLAAHLRRIFSEPAAARELGYHARDFALRSFSTERYLNGYRELLACATRQS